MSLALVTVDHLRPRIVRLQRGMIRCPKCEKPLFRTHLQAGWSFQTCETKRCDAEFWSLALPPECFGGWLAGVLGDDEAARIIRRVWPEHRDTLIPALWHVTLNDGNEPTWIQVAVRPRERHLHRMTPIRQFLKSLSIL